MDLSHLHPATGPVTKRKDLGGGSAAGDGKTSGNGHKGRGSRSGGNTPPGYEGGQMPLARRLPKRGFRNPSREEFGIVNLGSLERFTTGSVIDLAALQEAGLVRGKKKKVKILAQGELTKALTVKAHAFSQHAREKIMAAGGSVEVG